MTGSPQPDPAATLVEIKAVQQIAAAVRAERERSQLSIEEVAARAGLSAEDVRRLEDHPSVGRICNPSIPPILDALGLKLMLVRTRPCRRHRLATLRAG